MKSQWLAVGVLMTLTAGGVGAPAAMAKPADLPSQNGIECPDGSDDPMFRQAETPTNIDTVSPVFVPAGLEQLLIYLNEALANARQQQANGPRNVSDRHPVEARQADAQRLFEMAERQRRAGDLQQAYRLYQRVHLLAPTSPHGRTAIQRIGDIEERLRDATEEQGSPDRPEPRPEEAFRDMQRRMVPLGLVNVTF